MKNTTNNGITELWRKNDKIRIKVTDRCNMHCWFCHAEGTVGSSDIIINQPLIDTLIELHDVFKSVHITGGEPFLYKHLEELLEVLLENGYAAAITSNGCFRIDYKRLRVLDKLSYINISFHSLNASYYNRLTGSNGGIVIVDRVSENIKKLSRILPTRINMVVSGNGEAQDLDEMIHFANDVNCELKLVPELATQKEALESIDALLKRNNYRLFQIIHIVPGSNLRERYKDDCGNIIEVKKLAPYFPKMMCMRCSSKNECAQGFSFLRIGGNPLYCQACIKRSNVSCKEFMDDIWPMLKMEYIDVE